MGTRTSYEPGTFSFVELSTSDPIAAMRFYGRLFGWDSDGHVSAGDGVHAMARVDGDVAAGFTVPEPQGPGGPPARWLPFVTVASSDECAARAGDLGGTVHAGPSEMLDAARVAVLADPTGAAFGLWEPRSSIGADRVNDAGCLTSTELATDDVDAASTFYSELFGWDIHEVDTGGGPRYWLIQHDGALQGRNGGMRELGRPTDDPLPSWSPYFTVGSVEDTLEVAEGLGAATLMPSTAIPAGTFATIRDPQEAVFSIFEGAVDD